MTEELYVKLSLKEFCELGFVIGMATGATEARLIKDSTLTPSQKKGCKDLLGRLWMASELLATKVSEGSLGLVHERPSDLGEL